MTGELGRGVLGAGTGPADRGEVVPQLGRGLGQPDVDVAQLGERREQLDLGRGQPGVAEQREPRRQLEPGAAGPQPRHRLVVADVGRRLGHAQHQPAPQLGLPDQVGVEGRTRTVEVSAGPPVADQLRPLHGVRREEAGQPTGHREAAIAAQPGLIRLEAVTEVEAQRVAPGLAQALVDHLEQRPDQAVGIPGVVALAIEQQGDQRSGAEELDTGADAVLAAWPHAQPVREPLGQPALDPLGRHRDDFLGERIGQRLREQVAEGIGEEVGARSAVEVERHAGHPRGWRRQPAARAAGRRRSASPPGAGAASPFSGSGGSCRRW